MKNSKVKPKSAVANKKTTNQNKGYSAAQNLKKPVYAQKSVGVTRGRPAGAKSSLPQARASQTRAAPTRRVAQNQAQTLNKKPLVQKNLKPALNQQTQRQAASRNTQAKSRVVLNPRKVATHDSKPKFLAQKILKDFEIEQEAVEAKLKKLLKTYKALITFSSQTRYWLTKFQSTAGMGLVKLDKDNEIEFHLYLDLRYLAAAQKAIQDPRVILYSSEEVFIEFIKKQRFEKLLIETEYLNIAQAKRVREWVGKTCLLYDIEAADFRSVKSKEEALNIQKAVEISLEAFKWLRINVLVPGVSEAHAARALTQRMYHLGAQEVAFPPIVAFGANTANCHHISGETKLKPGDLVIIDFGAKYNNYCSDITRTFIAPGPSSLEWQKQEVIRKMWTLISQTAFKCRELSRPNTHVSSLDGFAYQQVEEAKMSQYWKHSLGHGVGLDIHESPRLSKLKPDVLEKGNVITIEPGVYVDNLGGIRVEDTLLVTGEDPIVLSRPYQYTKTTYHKEFDFFDLNILVREIKAGRTQGPSTTDPEFKDLVDLLRVYDEAQRTYQFHEQLAEFQNSKLSKSDAPKKNEIEPIDLDNIVNAAPLTPANTPQATYHQVETKKTRGRPKQEPVVEEYEEEVEEYEEEEEEVVPVKRRGRPPKALVQTPSVEEEEEIEEELEEYEDEEEEVVEVKPTRGRPTAARVAAVVPPRRSRGATQTTPALARRGRSKVVEEEEEEEDIEVVSPKPRGRRKKEEEVIEVKPKALTESVTKRRGRPKVASTVEAFVPKQLTPKSRGPSIPQPEVVDLSEIMAEEKAESAQKRRGRPPKALQKVAPAASRGSSSKAASLKRSATTSRSQQVVSSQKVQRRATSSPKRTIQKTQTRRGRVSRK